MSLSKTRENDPIRLRHMLDWARAADGIVLGETRAALDRDLLLRLAISRALQVIGEAANNITLSTRRRCQGIPWQDIIGMRHRLVHVYYRIDFDIIWTTATAYIPPLIADLEKLLDEETEP